MSARLKIVSTPAPSAPCDADPLALAGGRVTSSEVDGDVVARLQKAFDAAVVFPLSAASLLVGRSSIDEVMVLGALAVAALATFAHLAAVRGVRGFHPLCLIAPVPASIRALVGLAAASVAALGAIAVVGLDPVSWRAPGLALAGAAAALIGERLVIARMLARVDDAGRLTRRVAVVGGGKQAEEVIRRLSAIEDGEIDLCGFFDDRGDGRTPHEIDGCPYLGVVDDLVELSRWFRIDLVVVALPLTAERRLYTLLKQLWVIPADIRISALGSPIPLSRRTYDYIGTLPLLAAFDRPLSAWDALVKDAFDRIVASLALVALSPLLALVALAIRLDSPGPVLFRQPRYGLNNQLVSVYKFRSMQVDAADRDARRLVTRDDPRVTRVGRFIRRTSIDELPQLINVVRGELSLVGPRPHAVRAQAAERLYDEVVEGYFARHRVKPGVTGWAQVNGWRGETDTADKIERRVEHDLYYIDNWSLMFDVYILLRTPFALLDTRHAY